MLFTQSEADFLALVSQELPFCQLAPVANHLILGMGWPQGGAQ